MPATPSLPLGFGCSTIAAHPNAEDAQRLLHEALELGITHFDVARGYGGGDAERHLGRFLAGRRSQVVVVTKCGLNPVASSGPGRATHAMAQAFGAGPYHHLRQWARKHLRKPYGATSVRRSVETSLRELGTDHVEYLLLHEATIADANREPLVLELAKLQREGKVGQYGLGSEFRKLRSAGTDLRREFSVLQFEHSPGSRESLEVGLQGQRTVFTHSALKGAATVIEKLGRESAIATSFHDLTGVDPRDPAAIGGLLLAYSHGRNPAGHVVFSTTSVERLRSNVQVFRRYLSWSADVQRQVLTLFERDRDTGEPSLSHRS